MEECIICFEETNQFVFFPCAHKVCAQCHKQISRCPLCNYDLEHQCIRTNIQIQLVRTQPQIPKSYACSRICAFFLLTFVSYGAYHTLTRDPER